jgi:hypothetical protein
VVPEDWLSREVSAAEAVSVVRPGDHIFVGTACGTPRSLVQALEHVEPPVPGVTLVHFLTQSLFYRLPAEDVRTRFFHKLTSLSDAAAQALCSVNYQDEMAFAAVGGGA